jgi:hypothetical protein
MSRLLINRNHDLKALVDDGYELDIVSGHLVIYNVPYVNTGKQVKRGTLVSTLDLAGDVTTTPSNHVALFAGEHPCDREGRELQKIKHQSKREMIGEGLVTDHSFSSKPTGGYRDYHHKMTTYVAIISTPAQAIDPSATAQTRRVVETDDADAVFRYIDTASSRAGITAVSRKLALARIGIIGLGGTGSYILDLVAKTPVREIHLFDGDAYLQHNAFRSPGAPSAEELKAIPKKVHHHAGRYKPMRRGIVAHDVHIDGSNAGLLDGLDFVFLCVDQADVKRSIIEKLEELGVSFIDVGMGIELVDDRLQGILRVTASTPEKRDHVREKKRIGLCGGGADGVYTRNIQIAELNALNAALAVIKWKKLFGFYLDLEQEHHSTYTLDGNLIINDDQA